VEDTDGLGHTEFAADDWNRILVEPFLKVEEPRVHSIVIVGSESNQKYDTNED
jgi:hypothetical protein